MRITLLFVLAAALVAACDVGGKSFEPPGPPQLSIVPKSASLRVGDHQQFAGYITGQWGSPFSITWSSSAPAVAVVDTGMVTARAPGSALIILQVSAGVTLADTATVTVQ